MTPLDISPKAGQKWKYTDGTESVECITFGSPLKAIVYKANNSYHSIGFILNDPTFKCYPLNWEYIGEKNCNKCKVL